MTKKPDRCEEHRLYLYGDGRCKLGCYYQEQDASYKSVCDKRDLYLKTLKETDEKLYNINRGVSLAIALSEGEQQDNFMIINEKIGNIIKDIRKVTE